MTAPRLVEHFFRHEYGRLVAIMSRRVGVRHLPAIEDAAQSALMKALEAWKLGGLPDNPTAWLFRVAQNALAGELRQRTRRKHLLDALAVEPIDTPGLAPEYPDQEDVEDDMLRMLFACCDESIPIESQTVLALKTLCGFSVKEIALRLFTTEANAYKRLGRARARLRQRPLQLDEFSDAQFTSRQPSVSRVLYALFSEGYLSSAADFSIRRELCDEALRLCTLLSSHPAGQVPEVFALMALMNLHLARMTARQDGFGGLLLLEEQDRTRWDQNRIAAGLRWLAKSAQGDLLSRYHAEAAIAAEHCLAPSVDQTRWDRVTECYAMLDNVAPSPLNRLNRAVAMAEWLGPEAGLAVLTSFEAPHWLLTSHIWPAVLADLYRRTGDVEKAASYTEEALRLAPNAAVANLLHRRLQPGTQELANRTSS
ncbi:MAG: sigma-70 family RNA polymerase sigma factor [Devosia sp.]